MINFSNTEDLLVTVKTNQGVELKFDFQFFTVQIDGNEFYLVDDTLRGLFVYIGDNAPMSIYSIIPEAETHYEQIKREHELEKASLIELAQELSSPKQTGRI